MDSGQWHAIMDAEVGLVRAVFSYYEHLIECGSCRPLPPSIDAAYQKARTEYAATTEHAARGEGQ